LETQGCENQPEAQHYAGKALCKAKRRDFTGRRDLLHAGSLLLPNTAEVLQGCSVHVPALQPCVKCQMSFEVLKGKN